MRGIFGVVLSVVAIGMVWAQRTDPFAPKLHVLSLSCEPVRPNQIVVVGTVTNLSAEPVRITARAVLDGPRPQWFEGPVHPSPLPPGRTGEFSFRGPDPGSPMIADLRCTLDWFKDDAGRRLKYTHDEEIPDP